MYELHQAWKKSSREKVLKIVDNCGTIFCFGVSFGLTHACISQLQFVFVNHLFAQFLATCWNVINFFMCLLCLPVIYLWISGDLTIKTDKRIISQRNYQCSAFCWLLLVAFVSPFIYLIWRIFHFCVTQTTLCKMMMRERERIHDQMKWQQINCTFTF